MKIKDIKKLQAERGFTIVELLIVIVVIGILAAIVVVAYTGITTQANANASKGNAAAVLDAAENAYALTGSYPTQAQLETGVTQDGVTIKKPSGVTLTSTARNAVGSNTTVVYAIEGTPGTGVCVAVLPTGKTTAADGTVLAGGTATAAGIGVWATGTINPVTCS